MRLFSILANKKYVLIAVIFTVALLSIIYYFVNKANPNILNFSRKTVETAIAEGDEQFNSAYYQNALTFYQSALQMDKTHALSYLRIASVYTLKHQYQDALDIINQGLSNAASLNDLYLEAGHLNVELNQPEKARELLFLADTTNPDTHFWLGHTYFIQNNLPDAQKEFQTYYRNRLTPEGAYYLSLSWALSDPAKALDIISAATESEWEKKQESLYLQNIFDQAIKAKNDLYKTTLLCHALLISGFPMAARDPLLAVINRDPQYRDALLGLGTVYFTLGQENEALSYYDGAYKIDPNYAESSFLLGKFYLSQKDFVLAEEFLLRAVNLKPLNSTYRQELALFYEISSSELAVDQWKWIIEHEQDPVTLINARIHLAYYYFDVLGKTSEGTALANELTQTLLSASDPDLISFKDQITDLSYWSLFKNNKFSESLAGYENSIQTDSENPLSWYHQSVVQKSLGRNREAQNSLDRALDLDLNGIIRKLAKI